MLGNSVVNTKKLMSDAKYYEAYSRWDDSKNRYETWDEAVERVMNMHRTYYKDRMSPELEQLMLEVEEGYKNKLFLGSQRALQFGGEQLLKNHNKLYNCSATYCDRPAVFGEIFHLMLSGCGVGFSVQYKHIETLPQITERTKGRKTYIIQDSIEGWAEACDVLMSSYFVDGGKHPEYAGYKIDFDYSEIRPRGAYVSGGFKAPGHEGLKIALEKIDTILLKSLNNSEYTLKPIVVYDIIMYIADAVISGGVRRSACICIFSKNDTEMLNAKTGDWWNVNKQRGRSNNSVILLRDELTKEEFDEIMVSVKDYGEPGFIMSNNLDSLFNPCVEINLYSYTEDGRSGFSFCNLTEINGSKAVDEETFYKQCKLATIMGTLQAGYTDFKFVSKETKEIAEREALLGVSITGWMNSPDVLLNANTLKTGAEICKRVNREVAKLININPSARITTVKPAGNTSVLLGTASGIHGEHAARYFRHTQFSKDSEIAKFFMDELPSMVEESVWSKNDVVVAFPIETKEGSITKSELLGVKQLEKVVFAQQHWVNNGKNEELCLQPWLNHNVSNTITVDDWDEVADYIYNNRYDLGGVSLLAASGDKAYTQAPFTEVLTFEQVIEKYGESALYTSGLIEAGLTAFDGDLWNAINTALGFGERLSESSEDLLKRDFVRRFKKFTYRFIDIKKHSDNADYISLYNEWEFTNKGITELKTITSELINGLTSNAEDNKELMEHIDILNKLLEVNHNLEKAMGDLKMDDVLQIASMRCSDCLKDVYNLHKWTNIMRNIKEVDWSKAITKKLYTDVDTIAAEACAGGKCEI